MILESPSFARRVGKFLGIGLRKENNCVIMISSIEICVENIEIEVKEIIK